MQNPRINYLTRIIRRLVYILLIIFCALFVAATCLSYYWKPIIASEIRKSVITSTDSLYSVQFSAISINFLTGSFKIEGLEFIPDKRIFNRLKKINQAPPYLYEIKINKLKMTRIHPFRFYFKRELRIDKITINEPHINVINKVVQQSDTTANSGSRSFYDLIKGSLNILSIGRIDIHGIRFLFVTEKMTEVKKQDLYISDFNVVNFFIDSAAQYDSSKSFYADDIRVRVTNFLYPTNDKLYNLGFSEAILSTKKASVEFYGLNYTPRLGELEFKDTTGYRRTRYEINTSSVFFDKVDFKKLFYSQILSAEKLSVNKMNLSIFANKAIPEKPDKKRVFPVELLHSIDIPLNINQVVVTQSSINYGEFDNTINHKWSINFNRILAQMTNLTNDSSVITRRPSSEIKVQGRLNDIADLRASFLFHLGKQGDFFECKGSFGEFEGKYLNYLIVPFTKIAVANCNVKGFDFFIRGNKDKVKVQSTLKYKNLRVKVLQKDEDSQKLKKKGLASMIANILILRKDNPDFKGVLKSTSYTIGRKAEWSFFGYIWKSLLKGIKENIGVNEAIEKEVRASVTLYQDWKEEQYYRKERRLIRRRRPLGRF